MCPFWASSGWSGAIRMPARYEAELVDYLVHETGQDEYLQSKRPVTVPSSFWGSVPMGALLKQGIRMTPFLGQRESVHQSLCESRDNNHSCGASADRSQDVHSGHCRSAADCTRSEAGCSLYLICQLRPMQGAGSQRQLLVPRL